MIGFLRLFYFSKSGTNVINEAGTVLFGSLTDTNDINNDEIENFFSNHAIKCNDDRHIQNFRFQNRHVQIIQNTIKAFESLEMFTEHSQLIANKLANSVGSSMRNDFYLAIFTTIIDEHECLCIIRMEARTGVQVSNDITLNALERMLPDNKVRLQKAAIIFKNATEEFYEENEQGDFHDNIHSKIIDRIDRGISGYFFRQFLDSERVVDNPETSAKIAIDSIGEVAEQYLAEGVTKEDILSTLRKELSIQKTTSYRFLVDVINGLLDYKKMEEHDMDIESLGDSSYQYAKGLNTTVIPTFEAKYRFPPKKKIVDRTGQGRIFISYYESLEGNEDVHWGDDPTDPSYSLLRVNKSLIKEE